MLTLFRVEQKDTSTTSIKDIQIFIINIEHTLHISLGAS